MSTTFEFEKLPLQRVFQKIQLDSETLLLCLRDAAFQGFTLPHPGVVSAEGVDVFEHALQLLAAAFEFLHASDSAQALLIEGLSDESTGRLNDFEKR